MNKVYKIVFLIECLNNWDVECELPSDFFPTIPEIGDTLYDDVFYDNPKIDWGQGQSSDIKSSVVVIGRRFGYDSTDDVPQSYLILKCQLTLLREMVIKK